MSLRRIILLLLAGAGLWSAGMVTPAGAQIVKLPETQAIPDDIDGGQPDVQAAGTPEFPYGQMIRGTEATGYDRATFVPSASGRVEPKAGGARLLLPADLLQVGLKYNSPFRTGWSPTNAEIRLHPFYLDILSVSSSLLYSDNIDRTDTDRKDGVIGVIDLDVLGTVQFSDRLRLSFKAGLLYFPFENEFGVAGFTRDSASGRLFYGSDPYLLTQLLYDADLGEWQLHLYDRLRAYQALYSDQFDFVGGNQFNAEDRTGRYAFRSSLNPSTNGLSVNDNGQNDETFVEVVNTVGASVDRLLPTVTRLDIGAYHSDMWYYGDSSGSTAPSSRDVGYVTLASERETMRFKPFASFSVFRSDDQDWTKEVRGGIGGPITENLKFVGSAGYVWQGETGEERMVDDFRLWHVVGPYTTQQFRYRRDLAYPEEDLENSYTYYLRQTLGPYVYGQAFVQYASFEDLNDNGTGTDEWHTGAHFTFNPSSRTTIRAGGVFSQINYTDNSSINRYNRWTAIGQVRRAFGDSWETVLTYQFQKNIADPSVYSYYENLFVFTVTYYFGEARPEPSVLGEEPYNSQVLQNRGF